MQDITHILQGQEGSLQDLTQCVWNINAIRRALAKLSQTWANRLQHPEKAAAIIQMSRENSSEAFTSQPEFLPKSEDTFHSRTPSTVEGAMSLEGKATGLKMLVNNILAGTEEVERLGTPRAETSKEIEKNPEKDEKEQKGGKAEDSLQREDLGDNTSSETREEITTITSSPNHSPFLARSLASEREEANLEDVEENKEEQKEDEKGKIGNKARMLMKSFTAPSERTKPESSGNRTFSPVRQVLSNLFLISHLHVKRSDLMLTYNHTLSFLEVFPFSLFLSTTKFQGEFEGFRINSKAILTAKSSNG